MASKSQQVSALQSPYALFSEIMFDGLVIMEIFAEWTGPCQAVIQTFQTYNAQHFGKIKFVKIASNLVPWLRRFHGRCRPGFLFFFCGKLVEIVVGVNYTRFDAIIDKYMQLDHHALPEQFVPTDYFRELQPDPQFSKCYKQAIQDMEEAQAALKKATEEGVDTDANPQEAFDNVVFQYKDQWKQIKMFTDSYLQEQIGDLRVDMSGEDSKTVINGMYSNYGLQGQSSNVELLKTRLSFIQQVTQRKFDQNYIVAVFDYQKNQKASNQLLFEHLQRFYGEVVCKYQDKMYFAVLIKGITAENFKEEVESQFVYAQQINVLEDRDNVCAKVFNMKISNKNEEEVFDADFPTACFYFSNQDKLIEEHASCFAAKTICYQKFGSVVAKFYETGEVDCRNNNFFGYKGLKLQYLNKAKGAAYTDDKSIAVINLNSLNINIEHVIDEIIRIAKANPECYMVTCVDEIKQKNLFSKVVERYESIANLTIIEDIPAVCKPQYNQLRVRSYQIKPVRDQQYDVQSDLTLDEKLDILSSMEKPEPKPNTYIVPIIYYQPERTEQIDIFSLNQLETQIGAYKRSQERLKEQSDEFLPEDKDQQPQPVLQVSADEIVFYQRQLQAINKVNPAKNKFMAFVYLDQLSDGFYESLFKLYQQLVFFSEVTFFLCIRGLTQVEEIDKLAESFVFIKQFNMYAYKSGLHKVLKQKLDFSNQFFFLMNEQGEVLCQTQFEFELRNRIQTELGDVKSKQRKIAQEIEISQDEAKNITVCGQPIRFINNYKPINDQVRIVLSLFSEKEGNLQRQINQYLNMVQKHQTAYFITIIENCDDYQALKEKYAGLDDLNVAADYQQFAHRYMCYNGEENSRAFYVYLRNSLDCCCNELQKMQEIILDYTGTPWENGLKIKNKQLQFLTKSQLRRPGQEYIVALFQNDATEEDSKQIERLTEQLGNFYAQVQACFTDVYSICCVQGISGRNQTFLDNLAERMYCYRQLNLVEDADGFVAKMLSQPIFNFMDQEAEDEEYDVPKSACFVYDQNDKLVEAHANALDCKKYCCRVYNAHCWPRSVYERQLYVDVVDGIIQYKGAMVKFLNKVEEWKEGMWVAVHHIDWTGAQNGVEGSVEKVQQLLDEYPDVYQLIMVKGVKTEKQFEDMCAKNEVIQKFLSRVNVIQDRIPMPKPRAEMSADGGVIEGPTGYLCSLGFDRDALSSREFLDVATLQTWLETAISDYNRVDITDREAEFEVDVAQQLRGIMAEEIIYRGFKFTYLNRISSFPTPVRDDNFNENLEKSRFLLACVSTVNPEFDLQLFQIYKISQAFAKLYTIVLIKDCTNAEELAVFKNKFSFLDKLNVLQYKKGMFKRFQQMDGRFDQLYYVFSGTGNLVYKSNFADEFMEYAMKNQGSVESFALDEKKLQQKDVDRVEERIAVRGRLYNMKAQAGVLETQQGVVLAVFDAAAPGVAEKVRAYHALLEKQQNTYLMMLCTDNESQIPELGAGNWLEDIDGMAKRLLRGQDVVYYIFRNNIFQTTCVELNRMKDIVDKFIETRSDAIPDTITSVKQQDIKDDEEKHERKKKKSKVKREI